MQQQREASPQIRAEINRLMDSNVAYKMLARDLEQEVNNLKRGKKQEQKDHISKTYKRFQNTQSLQPKLTALEVENNKIRREKQRLKDLYDE